MQMAQNEAKPVRRNLEWWRSDDAYECRCAISLAQLLSNDEKRRRGPWSPTSIPEPEYPAIWFYDPETDQPLWLEMTAPIHVKDYARGYPDRLNSAARELLTRGYA